MNYDLTNSDVGKGARDCFVEEVTLNSQEFLLGTRLFVSPGRWLDLCKGIDKAGKVDWGLFVKVSEQAVRELGFHPTGNKFSNYVCCSPGLLRGSMFHFEGTGWASIGRLVQIWTSHPCIAQSSPAVTSPGI